MSKRYRSYRKKNKGDSGLVVGLLLALVLVGVVGALSKGFQEWNFNDWFNKDKTEEILEEKEKVNIKTIELETTKSAVTLTKDTALVFLNISLETPLFTTVSYTVEDTVTTYQINRVYEDIGGLKFGSSSAVGNISLDLIEDYTFTHCLIKGRTYYSYNSTTLKYTADVNTGISVNELDFQIFSTNEEDTSIMPPLEEKLFTFETAQKKLSLNTTGKRCVVYEIVLWTEI